MISLVIYPVPFLPVILDHFDSRVDNYNMASPLSIEPSLSFKLFIDIIICKLVGYLLLILMDIKDTSFLCMFFLKELLPVR